MSELESDALVFFGATGDLAFKKIFPALQAMVQRDGLQIPIIGMARAGWNLDRLRDRARASLENAGEFTAEGFAQLAAQLRYVDGDYEDPQTYRTLRKELGLAVPSSTPLFPSSPALFQSGVEPPHSKAPSAHRFGK